MLNRYGIKEATTLAGEAEAHAERIRIEGFTIVTELVPAPVLADARPRLDAVYDAQVAEVGGEDQLRSIKDADVVRSPLVADRFFLQFALNPRVRAVMDLLLGDYYILQQQNGVVNKPNAAHYQTAWHRDLLYQHFTTSRPIAVSCLYCLDDFRKDTGGTWVLPGSHRLEIFPSDDYVSSHEVSVTAAAGSALVFDSLLFHRAGENRSTQVRRGLNQVYALPFLKQQISLPRALAGEHADDPFLKKFLGYDSEPGDSALEWRRRRLPPTRG
jgi:ectoine hydroxylase-related dioxygenase (phytanoyl-CoA dioxygenase family)